MKVTIVPIVIDALGTVTKSIIKGPGGIGSGRMSGDYPNESIIENGQNTEKCPGDLRRFAVTQTPVKNHLETLMLKSLIIIIIIIIIIKLWNMQVTIIQIVIGAFGTVTKGLLKGLEDLEVGGGVETVQTTALLRTARILRRVLETWWDLLSPRLQWKNIGYRWCEKL